MSNTLTKSIIARVPCGIVVTNHHSFKKKSIDVQINNFTDSIPRRDTIRYDLRNYFSEKLYLLNCQRYIELNPVRASMVEEPTLYRWSSYCFNGLFDANQYVSPHPVYLSLGKDSKSRQAAYRDLFQSELDNDVINDIRQALTQNQPLGNSRFYTKIEAMTGQRREPKPRCRQKNQKITNMKRTSIKENCHYDVWCWQNKSSLAFPNLL